MKFKVLVGISLMMLILVISCQSDQSIEFARYYSSGSLLYQSHCQNCHGAKGEGLNALIPPLTDTVFIKNNIHMLACLVKNGLRGKITVHKRDFTEKMPPNDLAPIEIANVLTYVANSFGNKRGTIDVARVGTDLNNCR
ncbi:cytochrome c [Mucilaginibacter sp.]|uniref:c-type cytochrome n=1 Tax=Mucilaginibacter sp. TaxID=1882438 RepID=UPI00284EC8C2|nr:cytochrome c [Mucilaginibacter sp.]MDR3695101.1 cytochrome c [Mucilaginibacter sp.]